ncbi:hypothetical protein [Streptomyces sp. CA-132043]|uniref:hypothetical protein n=1 Tax=Streptomyces sp. CA-132043 TaxID=3240048 RepID=UPI003D8E6065
MTTSIPGEGHRPLTGYREHRRSGPGNPLGAPYIPQVSGTPSTPSGAPPRTGRRRRLDIRSDGDFGRAL